MTTEPLRGQAFRDAMKQAQSRTRKTPKTPQGHVKRTAKPAGDPDGTPLTATAHCHAGDWSTGPASWAEVNKAAEGHGSPGHSTAVIGVFARPVPPGTAA